MTRGMPSWLRVLLFGPLAVQAEQERQDAYRDYVRRLEYEAKAANNDEEHKQIKARMAELNDRLGQIERSVSASEAEVRMYARNLEH